MTPRRLIKKNHTQSAALPQPVELLHSRQPHLPHVSSRSIPLGRLTLHRAASLWDAFSFLLPTSFFLLALFLSACSPNILPAEAQRVLDHVTATANAEATRAQATADMHSTLSALSVHQTEVAIQITQAAATALPQQTAAAATPTAQALETQARATVVQREIDDANRREVSGWVGIAALAVVTCILIILLGHMWSESSIKLKQIEAKNQLELSKDNVVIQRQLAEIERLKVIIIGQYLFIRSEQGWQLSQLPAPTGPRTLSRELVERSKGEGPDSSNVVILDSETLEQRRLREFILKCIDVAGSGSTRIPSARELEMKEQTRDDHLKPIRPHIITQRGRGTGGTWLTGGRTLYDMLEANRRGELIRSPQNVNVAQ